MHHIYHTEGIILDSADQGESSKRYVIFTRDLGLIYARARGVRQMSSKLRFILTDFAYVKIDLVRGKNFWRVTSAGKTNRLEGMAKARQTLKVAHNVSRLLRRLLVSAEPNEKLFADLLLGFSVLEKCQTLEDVRDLEVLLVLRMLSDLGYIGGGEELENLIRLPLEEELLACVPSVRSQALRHINKALRESHL